MVLVHLLFKRSKAHDRIRCEGAVLPQTRPQYQRRRTKNELGGATARPCIASLCVYALVCSAALLYKALWPLCAFFASLISKT
jgi:hypothetical protein